MLYHGSSDARRRSIPLCSSLLRPTEGLLALWFELFLAVEDTIQRWRKKIVDAYRELERTRQERVILKLLQQQPLLKDCCCPPPFRGT